MNITNEELVKLCHGTLPYALAKDRADFIMVMARELLAFREKELNMNVYIIRRNDEIGYDEYDAVVVVEESPELALDLAKNYYGDDGWGDWSVTITKVDLDKPQALLGSFNAG